MKRYKFAVLALFAMVFMSCSFGSDIETIRPNSTHWKDELKLSGQVYTEEDDLGYIYKKYENDDLTVVGKNSIGGTGKIANGKLSFTIGIPDNIGTIVPAGMFADAYSDVTPPSFEGAVLQLEITGSGVYDELNKKNQELKINSATYKSDEVVYVYAKNDVTINGKGKPPYSITVLGYTVSFKTGDFSLTLKAGWNAIHSEVSVLLASGTGSGKISADNPDLKWVLE